MSEQIRGLERWEGETKEWNRRAGKLRMQAGPGIIDALENCYSQWQLRRSPGAARQYQLWRLRLHLKFNDNPEFLRELNDVFDIYLCDEEIGETFWHIPASQDLTGRKPFNWRRDSGDALRGGTIKVTEDEDENIV